MHESESEVVQSCPTLSDSMDWSLPGSSVHGIFQARVMEWGATAFSEESHGTPQNPARASHLPPRQESQVRTLGQEDHLEEEMVTHSSLLAWKIPWMEEPGGLPFMGSHRVRHY